MKTQDAAGFSVVELILAIVVGVTFLASMNLVTDNYTSLGKRSRNLVLVNSYAEAKIEGLRNSGYNSLGAGTTDITSELPSQLPGRSGNLIVTQEPDGIKQVDLSVSYKDGTLNRAYSYRTYIGELGVAQ